MKFNYVTLADHVSETDTVVVIDVLRAFSTAAFAFNEGVPEIYIVSSVDEAFVLREELHESFISGEVDGKMVEGFDFGNSPADLLLADIRGRRMIQRTTAGTQGLARYREAKNVFAASFVCAEATADAVKALNAASITFVVTGRREGVDGDEDQACAEYLCELIAGRTPDADAFLKRVAASSWGRQFGNPSKPHFPEVDLKLCMELDRFSFPMKLERRGLRSVLLKG
ncbi:MAG: 2-phosphosulfolactate phosphatase [Bdellovibrionota bacterium]